MGEGSVGFPLALKIFCIRLASTLKAPLKIFNAGTLTNDVFLLTTGHSTTQRLIFIAVYLALSL